MRDPYSILGVRRDAGADEIKAAWRNKAKTVHPDHNRDDPDANKRFAEVGRAYEVLKDPAKRSRYDEQRSKVEAMEREKTIMQQREAAREAAERAKVAKANAERIMAELAKAEAEKAKAERAAAEKIQAAKAKAEKDASDRKAAEQPQTHTQQKSQQGAHGNAKPAGQARTESPEGAAGAEGPEEMVSRIFGTGPEAQAAAEALRKESEARATGDEDSDHDKAHQPIRPASAFDLITQLVRRFRGSQPAPEKAPDLTTDALVAIQDLLEENTITATFPDGKEVRVPLEGGTKDGDAIRIKGQGLKIQGMLRGDVVVTIRVLKTEHFSVQDHDIRTVLPITLENAVLGCETTVETPTGTIDITIPAWSSSDHVLRVDGQGLPDGEGGRGALLVELRVMLWEKPDDKVTDLMRVMREGLYL